MFSKKNSCLSLLITLLSGPFVLAMNNDPLWNEEKPLLNDNISYSFEQYATPQKIFTQVTTLLSQPEEAKKFLALLQSYLGDNNKYIADIVDKKVGNLLHIAVYEAIHDGKFEVLNLLFSGAINDTNLFKLHYGSVNGLINPGCEEYVNLCTNYDEAQGVNEARKKDFYCLFRNTYCSNNKNYLRPDMVDCSTCCWYIAVCVLQ